jgi:hypothetical protein
MQNFGRGMWRRVGDYDRIQKPMILQQSRLEQWQQFVQHQTTLKQQNLQESSLNQKQTHLLPVVLKQDIQIEENIKT